MGLSPKNGHRLAAILAVLCGSVCFSRFTGADESFQRASHSAVAEDFFDQELLHVNYESEYLSALQQPGCAPCARCSDGCTDVMSSTTPRLPQQAPQPPSQMAQPFTAPVDPVAAAGLQSYASAVGPGYIGNAILQNQFRFRYNSAYNGENPGRAEFLYQCYQTVDWDQFNFGAPSVVRELDYQSLEFYLESLINDDLSMFIEVPVLFMNPTAFTVPRGVSDGQTLGSGLPVDNNEGFGDISFGLKIALVQPKTRRDPHRHLTFQLRASAPTGDPGDFLNPGLLGRDYFAIEPGFLYLEQFDSLVVMSELRFWIPTGGTDDPALTAGGQPTGDPARGRVSGNVARYGLGAGYTVVDNCHVRVTPMIEAVGWSVLDGLVIDQAAFRTAGVTNFPPWESARTTIVNIKLGARIGLGGGRGYSASSDSLYLGWGHAVTGNNWYEDILRFEYQMAF